MSEKFSLGHQKVELAWPAMFTVSLPWLAVVITKFIIHLNDSWLARVSSKFDSYVCHFCSANWQCGKTLETLEKEEGEVEQPSPIARHNSLAFKRERKKNN